MTIPCRTVGELLAALQNVSPDTKLRTSASIPASWGKRGVTGISGDMQEVFFAEACIVLCGQDRDAAVPPASTEGVAGAPRSR